VTGAPAGTPLQGAVFEITRAKSGAVVGYITSDARGVAASEPLPLGRYYVREVTPARYYVLNPERFEAELEYAGQIVKLSLFNKSAALGTAIKKTGNYEVLAGDSMWYGITVENTSSVPLSDFYWSDRLPTDSSKALTLITGTYNQRLYYRVLYRSQLGGWKTLASNLLTTNNYSFSLSAGVLGLAQGDAVMEVKLEFGTVQPGFRSESRAMISVLTLPGLVNGYEVVNRSECGGLYMGAPQVSLSSWVTKVVRLGSVPTLPKTGY
jgi:uncharacterized repeat protein (TIGR01451 family)